MAPYRDVLPTDSEWMEKCARHTAKQTARTLQHIYLCDPCAKRLVAEALNGRPFLYHGETIAGYCGLCNEHTEVTLRQHFACATCWAVVTSYSKGFVSAKALLQMWAERVASSNPGFYLQETDQIRLEPYVRAKKTKYAASKTLSTLDFLATETGHTRFHIELKTGPQTMDAMSEFQLDVNDFDDIIGASCNSGTPSYIVHIAVRMDYLPPTKRITPVGIWWTDFKRLRDSLKSVRKRRGEDKYAGYFDTSAFETIDTFSAAVASRSYEALLPHLDRDKLALPEAGKPKPRAKH